MFYTFISFFWILSSLIVITSGLNITFPKPPFAATNNTYIWIRETNDPQDFFLQKIKIDGDKVPTAPFPRVAVPNLSQQEGEGLIDFNRAGVFQIIAVDTQNPQENPFFEMLVTVQVNTTSSTSTGHGTGAEHKGDGHSVLGGSHIQRVGVNPTSVGPSSDNPVASTGASTDSKSSAETTIILSSILGALVLLVFLGLGLFWLRRREERRRGLVNSHLDGTVNQASKEGTVYPFTLPQSIDRSGNTREKKSMMVPNPVRSSGGFDVDHQEGTAGMRVEARRDSQQDAGTKERMKFEEESVDRPPTYVSR